MVKHVFGIAGCVGAGKSTVAEYMKTSLTDSETDVVYQELSNVVRSTFRTDHPNSEITDNELGEWAAMKKDTHGDDYFANTIAETWDEIDAEYGICSGLRSPAEAEALFDTFGADNVTIVAVWTLPSIRFRRKYDAKPDKSHPEWDTFVERNEREIHEWGCVEFFVQDGCSDYVLPNNATEAMVEAYSDALLRDALGDADERRSLAAEIKEAPFVNNDTDRAAQFL